MSVDTFIPTIWSARLLMHLDNALVAQFFYNKDYEGDISDYGDTVKINQVGAIEIFDYVRNQDMQRPQELDTGAQELIIDQAKAFNFQIDDVDAVQMRAPLMDSAMQRSAFTLAETLDTFLFGRLDAAMIPENIAEVSISTPAEMYEALIQLRTILTRQNVPMAGRRAAMSPEAIALLLKDDRFVATGGTMAESLLVNGSLGRAAGFDIFEANTTPSGEKTVGTDEVPFQTVIAGHQLASTFAAQILKTEAYRMEARFADGVKGLHVYGAKVLVPEAIAKAEIVFA